MKKLGEFITYIAMIVCLTLMIYYGYVDEIGKCLIYGFGYISNLILITTEWNRRKGK